MKFDGPAAGSPWLKTKADPAGQTALGTLNNCAGGKTPWGTFLTAEENFHQYFGSSGEIADAALLKSHTRYGLPVAVTASQRRWETFYERFDVFKDPNEAFRFGWIVEIDPFDPAFVPVKHTALGRFRHEGATFAVSPKGQVAFYTGDDSQFDYVYKFVSKGTFDPVKSKAENAKLLAEGTLYVARFNDNGSGEWLPLIFGQGRLTAANGFASQADVLVHTRLAGDAVGATKMDRPEDIEQNPVNKKIYMIMTNNSNRGADNQPGVDAANPRKSNRNGHILEVTEAGDDVAATRFTWEIFMLCGNPSAMDPTKPETEVLSAGFDIKKVSPIACPDNLTFDKAGNLWIATDGMPSPLRFNDGLYAVPVDGPSRGELKMFFSSVQGAEVVGPEFTPDETSLFLGLQHPGEGATSTFELPLTRWPDHNRKIPPRPSLLVIQQDANQPIGSV
jgi:secreted PhoX family phosphatase